MRILSLDISTNTGWALLESTNSVLKVVEYGQLEHISEPTLFYYPKSYVYWADQVLYEIETKILNGRKFDHLVIEETAAGARNSYDQKILEFIHMNIARYLLPKVDKRDFTLAYLRTGEWRGAAGCHMTAEEKKRNIKVTKVRKAAEAIGKKVVLVELEPGKKKVGKINKKHVAIRRVKEIFDIDLLMKQNDIADAICIGVAHHNILLKKENGVDSKTKELL